MTPKEQGFLLLTSHLGNPERKPLTVAQLRTLAERIRNATLQDADRDLCPEDLTALGYGTEMARRIVALMEENQLLAHFLHRGEQLGCTVISRIGDRYPGQLRRNLGLDSPGCLWAKGDLSILDGTKIALVGSRDLEQANRDFAAEVGRQAALQGCTLVSGNARGADRTAQEACLAHGGRVISVVADELAKQPVRQGMLYLSEDGFEEAFTAQRALSRNRVIHALGGKTLVAQCGCKTGGTWDGTVKNLRFGWSPVCCFDDGSEAMELLQQMGAEPVSMEQLSDLGSIGTREQTLFDY